VRALAEIRPRLAGWLSAAMVMPAGVALAASLVNPGFESGDLTGWTAFGDNGNIYVESVSAQEGAYSLKLYQQFTGSNNYSGVYQDLPCSPGVTYQLSGYLRNGFPSTDYLQTNNRAFLKLEWYDSSGNYLGAVENYNPPNQGINWDTPQDDAWRYNAFQATAPANAATVRVVCMHAYEGTAYEGGSSWFDNLDFGEGAVPEAGTGLSVIGGFCVLYALRVSRRRPPPR